MTEKQPLVPNYAPPSAPPPAYQPQYPPPPTQAGHYTHHQTNTAVYVQPTQQTRVLVEIKPPNYVVLSIITMLCFCWVFGLIALIIGLQVDSIWLRGDREEARRQSRRARLWNIIGMIVGAVLYVIVVVVSVSVRVAAANSCHDDYYNNDYC